MKKKPYISIIAIILLMLLLVTTIDPHTSSSAYRDLTADLIELHGEPYVGREVEGGTENMTFSIKGRTFFPANYTLYKTLGIDYRYTCKVIYTTHLSSGKTERRTVTYTGYDPMGRDQDTARAYIDVSTKR